MTNLEKVLEIHSKVVEDGYLALENPIKYKSYAISTLRGGVGKSTLAFNLSFEMSRKRPMLVADLCAQCNLTETLRRGRANDVTILSALQPKLLGSAFGDIPGDISYRISETCEPFKPNRASFLIPGDALMFAFPSTMYQTLQMAHTIEGHNKAQRVCNLLESLRSILDDEAVNKKTEGILMDTSPFYAGGTHLAWCAADAVIIPVRVDEHSIASLELTLDLLCNPDRDFLTWNKRAGGRGAPKVAAIVMTMVGSKSQQRATPDRASRMYIERALAIASKYPQAFDRKDIADCFVITDDFVSSGRISGSQGIPISKLLIGKFYSVEGRQLQVNSSAARYQKELAYLVSVI